MNIDAHSVRYQLFYSCLFLLFIVSPSFLFANTIENSKQAKDLSAQADSLTLVEAYADANDLYLQVLSFYQKEKNPNAVLDISTRLIVNFQQEGNYPKAIAFQDSILKNIDSLSVEKSILALAYHKHGVSYYGTRKWEQAIAYFSKALSIRKAIYPPNHIEIVRGHRNIGNALIERNKYDKASQELQQALTLHLSDKQRDTVLLTSIHENLGLALQRQEDFEKAEEHLLQALAYAKALYKEEPWEIANVHNTISDFYYKQKKANPMLLHSQNALEIYQAIDEKYDEDWWGVADSYNNLGIGYELQNELQKAIESYQTSMAINERLRAERLPALADNYTNIALVFKKKRDTKKALNYQNIAFEIYEQLGDRLSVSDCFHNMGKIYELEGDLPRALTAYQASLEYGVVDFEAESLDENPTVDMVLLGDKPNLVENIRAKAQALVLQYEVEKDEIWLRYASKSYRQIDLFLDAIKTDFESDESKTFLINKAKNIYEEAIQVALDLYELTDYEMYLEEAFQLIERSKAIVLLDAVKDNQAKARSQIPKDLLAKERSLKSKIGDLEEQLRLLADGNEALKVPLRQELIASKVRYSQLRKSLEIEVPAYKALMEESLALDFKSTADLLDEKEALLQYFLGEKELIIFYISQEKEILYQRISLDFPIVEWVSNLKNGICNAYVGGSTSNQDSLHQLYVKHAQLLYQKLIQPIKDKTQLARKIYIVPDGVLGYIPFDALLSESVSHKNYSEYPYFGKKHPLSYSYSVSLLRELKKALVEPAKNQILALAPSFAIGNTNLPPLLNNQEEVSQILTLFRGKALREQKALKADFMDLASDYSVLHFSSHARTIDSLPSNSFIAFSQFETKLNEAELLYVRNLYATRLQAELIVLSACETGLGKIEKGEGIISLARAFAYAGAKSIVTTLWRVNDQRTTEIMVDFYKELQGNKAKDEALWLAKQKMIEGGLYAHPYYWAAFIPIGNMETIAIDKPRNWYYIAFGFFVGLLIFFGSKLWKR